MRDLVHHGVDADTDWMDHAACVGYDPDLFFPPPGRPDKDLSAIGVCWRCPVREACLEFAISTHQDHGIWGGHTATERARIRRQRRRSQ